MESLSFRPRRVYTVTTQKPVEKDSFWLPSELSHMKFLTFHFAGGDAFFSGIVLLLLGLIVTRSRGWPGQCFVMRLVMLLGAVLVAFSSTPLPQWLYAIWLFLLVACLALESRRTTGSPQESRLCRDTRWKRAVQAFHVGLTVVTLAAASWEILWRANQQVDKHSFSTMYVIGDSLSAGIFGAKEPTWPRQLQQRREIEVIDLSREGATAKSALAQANLVNHSEAVVLVEIGGNDLLGGTGSEQFAVDLNALLHRLHQPGRQVVMLELPLPPFFNQYGRIQRTTARKYNVTLIPRRRLAGVIFSEDTTVDGLHLSAHGHRLLSQMIWEHVAKAFQVPQPATVPLQPGQ